MNILASIKAPKSMSFKHWRYRLLHWCFGEKATTPEDSNLPHFLYTHYCPLFHLTNLIAILFPVILLVKIIGAIIWGVGKCCVYITEAIGALPWHKIENWWKRKFPPKAPRPRPEPSAEEIAAVALKEEKKHLLTYMLKEVTDDVSKLDALLEEGAFENFWNEYRYRFDKISEDVAKEFYNTRMTKIVKTKKKVLARKEKMRQRMIFWTQFSEVFFRWTFNIFYICLAVFVGWLTIKYVPPIFFSIVDFFKWIFTFDIMPFLKTVGAIAVRVIVVGGAMAILIYGFIKFRLVQKCGGAIGSSLLAVSPPFVLLAGWAALPFKWIASAFCATIEFVEMFYKENCPPITIVSGEDEQIATELGDD